MATIFIGGLALTPVYALDSLVMPELDQLKTTYESMDQTSQDIADGKDYQDSDTFKSADKLAAQKR